MDRHPGSQGRSFLTYAPLGRFGFDRILDSRDPQSPYYASQAVVYKHVGMRIVQDCLRGYNCCVFANGRTATGKTSPPGPGQRCMS